MIQAASQVTDQDW